MEPHCSGHLKEVCNRGSSTIIPHQPDIFNPLLMIRTDIDVQLVGLIKNLIHPENMSVDPTVVSHISCDCQIIDYRVLL